MIRNWWLNNLGMTFYPCIHITFDLLIVFWIPSSLSFIGPQASNHFHGSAFWFCSYNTKFSVFCLTSNMLVKKHRYFLALGFLTGVDVIGTLGLLSVNTSGVNTIVASRISLRFCWPSHLPACWYIFLCCSCTCVQKNTCYIMIGQYQ